MEDNNFMNELIRKSVTTATQSQFEQVNYAIKRDGSGKLEYSVNGINPNLVVEAFKALERVAKKEGL